MVRFWVYWVSEQWIRIWLFHIHCWSKQVWVHLISGERFFFPTKYQCWPCCVFEFSTPASVRTETKQNLKCGQVIFNLLHLCFVFLFCMCACFSWLCSHGSVTGLGSESTIPGRCATLRPTSLTLATTRTRTTPTCSSTLPTWPWRTAGPEGATGRRRRGKNGGAPRRGREGGGGWTRVTAREQREAN